MTGFSEEQLKALRGKLAARHVRTRKAGEFELSYIEGWFAIAEANRIFGFDGWKRETVDLTCLWQGRTQGQSGCSYSARVRVTVHAGERTITREGSGFGSGSGTNPGEAHEKALKEAETDAMKRTLVTFGNRFGLALYDREQRGVTQSRKKDPDPPWSIILPGQATPTLCATPHEVYAELRKHLESLTTPARVQELWQHNETMLKALRERHRELVDRAGTHYTAVFANLCRDRAKRLGEDDAPGSSPVDKSLLAIGAPKRVRNREHLRFVASHPCLVCSRQPAHAHHLTFTQPRAWSLKVGDEWTVPLCATHHRELHARGNELAFWQSHKVDPKAAAEALWGRFRGDGEDGPSDTASTARTAPE